MNALIVELIREHDVDEYGILYLSQDPSTCNSLTGPNTSKIGALAAHNNDIDLEATDLEGKGLK